MRLAPSGTGGALPPWLVLAGSAAIVLHLAAVVVPILDSQSGPWSSPVGPQIDQPPGFARAVGGLAGWHAEYLRTSNSYHFIFNRPGDAPAVRMQVRLRDEAGQVIRTVSVPDPQANPWVRQREELLVRGLGLDMPVPPPSQDLLPPPGQPAPTAVVWLSRDDVVPGVNPPADRAVQLWLATVPKHLVPRNKELIRPSDWAILLAHSFGRRLCRETPGAATAEVVRISRQPVTPSVLYGEAPPPDALNEVTASFGEVSPPMNASPSKPTPAKESPPAPQGPVAAWTNFWFAPADSIALSVLRVLGGLLFLFWLLPFAGRLDALFGLNGWFDGQAYHEASHLAAVPPHLFSWSILYLCGTNSILLMVVYGLSLAVLVLFTLGLWTRATGLLTYVVVVSFTANPATSYDADTLLVMLAFYLMLGHLLLGLRRPGQSWAARLLGPKETWLFRRRIAGGDASPPTIAANLAVRLIQVHFAIVMLASGLLKLQVREWWAGVAPWFYLHPPLRTSLQDLQDVLSSAETYRVTLSLMAYGAVAWQIGFPAFAWRRRCRPLLLGGAALAWLADAFFFGLPLLGPIMVMGCLSYLSPGEWRGLAALLGWLPPLRRLRPASAVVPAPLASREAKKGQDTSAITGGRSR